MQTKTDNSFLNEKIYLRYKNIKHMGKLSVLDCFHGSGHIWNNVQKIHKHEINIIAIDKKPYRKTLIGDNIKFLKSMDLNNFSCIDLDAYGIPYKQLDIVFNKKYKGIVFFTYIQTMFGALPIEMLINIGYTKEMVKKCPFIFSKNMKNKLFDFLFKNNVKNIQYYLMNRKFYGCIVL